MRDYKFGTYLYNLRREVGLSQAELGRMVGVTNKAVSKWETGEAKPAVKTLIALSKIFDVSIEEMVEQENKKEKQLHKIVITGGPCAGKSTALSWIQEEYTKKGYAVVIVPESATELILAGLSFQTMVSNYEFELLLTANQISKERLFEDGCTKIATSDKILIVCDRGALDGKAYVKEGEFKQILRVLGLNEIELRDSYDAVFHLVTAAKGAEEYYTLSNNEARRESAEEARIIDEKTLASWAGHPHLRVIDNSSDFKEKMRRLMKEISSFLGEPEPNEIERKFLIRYPDLNLIDLPTLKKVEIIQTYLRSGLGEEIRVRQRGLDGDFVYTKTIKKRISDMKRLEIEKQITKDEYLALLLNADTSRRQIRKTRYCFVYENKYFEIDIYPFWKNQAIMEIELNDENEDFILPEFVEVIKEVTGDEDYSNFGLSRID